MKVLVPVKRAVDYNVKIRVKSDQSGIELNNVKMSMNPFDEIAIEEAVSIGPDKAQETIRTAMAIGADRGILVQTDAPTDIGGVEPLAVAKTLKAIVDKEKPDFIIMGKQSIDDDSNQTGQMLAALLGWAQGTFASELEIKDGKAIVTREIDGGLETIALALPAIITTDLRLNEPRYASLPNIMKAKKKELTVMTPEELGVDLTPRLSIVKVAEPAERVGGGKVSSVDELIDKLKNEAKVI